MYLLFPDETMVNMRVSLLLMSIFNHYPSLWVSSQAKPDSCLGVGGSGLELSDIPCERTDISRPDPCPASMGLRYRFLERKQQNFKPRGRKAKHSSINISLKNTAINP